MWKHMLVVFLSLIICVHGAYTTETIQTTQLPFTVHDPSLVWQQNLTSDLSVVLAPMYANRTLILSITSTSGGGSLVKLGFLPKTGNDPLTGTWMGTLLGDITAWKADPMNYASMSFLPNGTVTRFIDITQAVPAQVSTQIFQCDSAASAWTTSCPETGPNPPDWGTLGIGIGLAVSFVALILCSVFVGLAYCRHEKTGPWAPLQRRKRLINGEPADREQVDHSKSDFKQQRFKYWTPELTPGVVVGAYVAVGIIFLIIGPVLYVDQNNVHEVYARYDNLPECISAMGQNLVQPYDTPIAPNATPRGTCVVSVVITEDMPAPVFFYYRLTNFYQNHWRYVKSRDDKSNRNKGTSASDCKPDISFGNSDIQAHAAPFLYPLNAEPSLLNASLFLGRDLYPCGLVAQSWFNDKFINPCVTTPPSTTCEYLSGDDWNKTGIAWSRDLGKRFVARPLDPSETNYNPRGFQMPSVEDEDFIVWMRQAPLPTFEKLNKRILNRGFTKGEVLNVTIENNYPVHMWSGHKGVLLATANSLGTKNFTLGAAFIVIGVFSWIIALFFAVKIWFDKKWSPDSHLVESPQDATPQD